MPPEENTHVADAITLIFTCSTRLMELTDEDLKARFEQQYQTRLSPEDVESIRRIINKNAYTLMNIGRTLANLDV